MKKLLFVLLFIPLLIGVSPAKMGDTWFSEDFGYWYFDNPYYVYYAYANIIYFDEEEGFFYEHAAWCCDPEGADLILISIGDDLDNMWYWEYL